MARLQNQPTAIPARARPSLKRLLSISHVAIDYPRSTVILWAIVSVLGVLAFFNLKLGLLPDITFPVVVVTVNSNEINPDANERTVTVPIEDALKGIAGITSRHSLTYPEFVVVDIAFDVSRGLDARRDEVSRVLGAVRLPAGAKLKVLVENLNETSVSTYAIRQPGRSLADLDALANREFAPRLRSIPGVLSASVIGAGTGSKASAYRVDGSPAIAVSIVKTAAANTLDVASDAERSVAGFAATHPGLTIERTSTQATYIREATQATQEALGLAIVLAIVVILPFLRDWRATGISAIAIPVSLAGTAIVMWALNFKLETITLLALALVVGVILDDAIVAVENIVRHLEDGETPKGAALEANREIGLTLVAASLTIVAVFLPIGLMSGTLGQFFRPFGLTASAAVLWSLLAARTLSPALAAWWLRRRRGDAPREIDVENFFAHPSYRRLLGWALRHRIAVIGIALATFAAGLALIPFIPKGFIPHLDRGEFIVNFRAPIGTSMPDTESIAKRLETSIALDPAVSGVDTTIGERSGQQNVGTIDVRLRHERKVTTVDVENAVRKKLPTLDGVVTSVADVPFVGSSTTKPVDIALLGRDLDPLRQTGLAFQHALEATPGFLDVGASGLSDGTPFSAIEHVDGKRAVQITADLGPGVQIGDADATASKLAGTLIPKGSGITVQFGGTSQDSSTTYTDFGIALALSVVAIVVVLLVLFRSWVDPLVIASSLPLSIVGALFALWITRADFGMISLMAVIFLFGLVNKNAILLVDRIKKLRSLGFARSDAIREAGAQRLRPILMTTAATILGMLPIALGFGAGAELRAPMAVAIIGGLITSTLLSLVVVPVVYTIFDDWAHGGEFTVG